MTLRISPILFAFGLLFAVPAYAATGTGSTASGTTLETGALLPLRVGELRTALNGRLPETRDEVALPESKILGWQSNLVRTKQKASALRASCFQNIREANRDTLLTTAMTCERGDLMQEVAFLRKQSAEIAALPLIAGNLESGATLSISKLIDADMTVVGAIDAGLYMQIDQLLDAKKKLTTQYRMPYWLDTVKVRADRQLVWIGLMVTRLEEVLNEDDNTDAMQSLMLNAVNGMQSAIPLLQGAIASEDLTIVTQNYNDAMVLLGQSRLQLKAVARLKEVQEQAQQSSNASSK